MEGHSANLPVDRSQEAFTQEELTEQLLALGVDEEIVARAFANAAQRRIEERPQTIWDAYTRDFVAAYHRITAKGVSDSNIEGWHDLLYETALELLEYSEQVPHEEDPLWQQTVKAVAVTSFYWAAQNGELPDEDLLRGAGIEPDQLYAELREIYFNVVDPANNADTRARLANKTASTRELVRGWAGAAGSELWAASIGVHVERLYSDLKANNFGLPTLGRDGKYPEENE